MSLFLSVYIYCSLPCWGAPIDLLAAYSLFLFSQTLSFICIRVTLANCLFFPVPYRRTRRQKIRLFVYKACQLCKKIFSSLTIFDSLDSSVGQKRNKKSEYRLSVVAWSKVCMWICDYTTLWVTGIFSAENLSKWLLWTIEKGTAVICQNMKWGLLGISSVMFGINFQRFGTVV
jgi:hypothetical protein